jgi:hypothetical protein
MNLYSIKFSFSNNLIGPRALYAAGHSTYEEQPPKLSIYSTLEVSKKTEESQGRIFDLS